jgi:glycosyltransferase involved in cell wall biosynthesis
VGSEGKGDEHLVSRSQRPQRRESASLRPQVSGKFLARGGHKLPIHGVTYGTFRPDQHGYAYPPPTTVARDFAQMAANAINAVRTYTVPPPWLLDLAQEHGLLVMAGMAWEHHVAFLDDRSRPRHIERRVRAGVRACAGHPAILAYSIGNEIPAPIVRWHGRGRVQRYLQRLVAAAKEEDPGALVTYVNYPSTEYLELDCVDFLCFNVYLEQEERLRAYLARLHNLAGDRPLVLAELGLDSRRNGLDAQAASLGWQLRAALAEGCAGAFVYAWTDEWYVTYLGADGTGQGGTEIVDWDFGLTDRARRPKPALHTVRRAFDEAAPRRNGTYWPRISVVVCSYNGAATIGECCEALSALDYPDYEVLVVDDGSSDATGQIAAGYGLRVVRTENRGLSSARNTGWRETTGEIVAYTDDDAAPDRDWLYHLARSFLDGGHAGVGGPNVAPLDSGATARCVSNAPGTPTHVLLSDREAEHIPGCNSAFRRDVLEAVGGFDPRFRVAGDDVDICWRIREREWTLGFSPAAMVLHRPRSSIAAYWRQQRGYGRAEAQLERKWPRRYNSAGYTTWRGRVYGGGLPMPLRRRARVYHGRWGTAPFQPLYQGRSDTLGALPATPEWYLLTLVLSVWAGVALLAGVPWLVLVPPAVAAGMSVAVACLTARHARRAPPALRRRELALIALLCAMQPAARLHGRLQEGLTPWRRNGRAPAVAPWPRSERVWSEQWRSTEQRLADIEDQLSAIDAAANAGGDCDRWDHEVAGGCLSSARLRTAVEEHGAGRQLVRFRIYPRINAAALTAIATLALLAAAAAVGAPGAMAGVLATMAVVLVARAAMEASRATGQLVRAVAQARREVAVVDERARAGERATSGQERTAALERAEA